MAITFDQNDIILWELSGLLDWVVVVCLSGLFKRVYDCSFSIN